MYVKNSNNNRHYIIIVHTFTYKTNKWKLTTYTLHRQRTKRTGFITKYCKKVIIKNRNLITCSLFSFSLADRRNAYRLSLLSTLRSDGWGFFLEMFSNWKYSKNSLNSIDRRGICTLTCYLHTISPILRRLCGNTAPIGCNMY